MAGSRYYLRRGDEERGPFTSRELRKLAAHGMILPDDEVRKGQSKWVRAITIHGLFKPFEPEKSDRTEAAVRLTKLELGESEPRVEEVSERQSARTSVTNPNNLQSLPPMAPVNLALIRLSYSGTISASCAACGMNFSVPDELDGSLGQCPCGATFSIQRMASASMRLRESLVDQRTLASRSEAPPAKQISMSPGLSTFCAASPLGAFLQDHVRELAAAIGVLTLVVIGVIWSVAGVGQENDVANAGQFLINPGEFFGWFNAPGILAVLLMLLMLTSLLFGPLQQLNSDLSIGKFCAGLAMAGTISIVCTLVLTCTSIVLFSTVARSAHAEIDQERLRVSGIKLPLSSTPSQQSNAIDWVVEKGQEGGLREILKHKAGRLVGFLVTVLLFVGAGYAYTLLNLGFWPCFVAMSAGVGLPEEMSKALAGMWFLYSVFDTKSMPVSQFRCCVLVSFAVAGLGFGAAEALKYFGSYYDQDVGLFCYGIRAVWCVPLHGAWTLLVGAILIHSLPQDPASLRQKDPGECVYLLVLAAAPVALVHGLYNAGCEHGQLLPWIVGGFSMLLALEIIAVRCHEQWQARPSANGIMAQG